MRDDLRGANSFSACVPKVVALVIAGVMAATATTASATEVTDTRHVNLDFAVERDLLEPEGAPLLAVELGVQWGELELRGSYGRVVDDGGYSDHASIMGRWFPTLVRARGKLGRPVEMVAPYLELGGGTQSTHTTSSGFAARLQAIVGAGIAIRAPSQLSVTIGMRHHLAPARNQERWRSSAGVAQSTAMTVSLGLHL